jgi:hypothetical protein
MKMRRPTLLEIEAALIGILLLAALIRPLLG